MITKERFYDAFGELIYAVMKAEGSVNNEDTVLQESLEGHDYANNIKWSFEYEKRKENKLEAIYEKALSTFKEHGPDREYTYLIEILDNIIQHTQNSEDDAQVTDIANNLRAQFVKDLEEHRLRR